MNHPAQVEALFFAALEKKTVEERTAFLESACGDDAELRRQVERLLQAHPKMGDFLNNPAPAQLAAALERTEGTHAFDSSLRSGDEDNTLAFLQPSTRPDSLGRLGHYEMLQVLGRGGFGIVFRAFDEVLQRVVAVKVMAPQIATLSPARKRFVREAQSSAKVRHEHVVQVYEVGEQPLPYLTMEFIPGETLQQKLDRNGPLEVPEVLRIGRQIAEGLAAAHACDLIHRDIKPGNILLEGEPGCVSTGSNRAKITDFGLARAADDASISQSGIIAGTPMFMAPEQALGHKIDQRADLFSLGSVLYQMASGRPPFRAPGALAVLKRVAEEPPRPIVEIIPETPEWLCDIIAKLHAKNPEERFQSAREVADLLADCEAKLKAKQDVKTVLPAAVKPARRKWRAASVSGLFFLLACVVVGYLFGKDIAGMLKPEPPPGPIVNQPQDSQPGPRILGVGKENFVPLFNGQNLTGWKTHPQQPGEWTVENGLLVGHAGPRSHLYTERGDFHNFELRCEVKLNANANSGITIRTPFALREPETPLTSTPAGYEVQVCEGKRLDGARQYLSGAIIDVGNTPKENLICANQWHTVVIKAKDDQFETSIDDVQTLVVSDPQRRWQGGHIALQVYLPGTRVEFRKIEIKELPARSAAEPGPTSSWTRFPVPGAGFSVALPPQHRQSMEVAIPDGRKVMLHGAEERPEGEAYLVMAVLMDAKTKSDLTKDPKEGFRRLLRGAISQKDVEVDQVKQITVGNLPGNEIVVRHPDTGKHLFVRIFVIQDHVGVLTVIGNAATPTAAAQAYLNSIRVEKLPSPP